MYQYYGFGPYAFELLAGYDCPTYATFLNTSFHASEISKTHPNSYVASSALLSPRLTRICVASVSSSRMSDT